MRLPQRSRRRIGEPPAGRSAPTSGRCAQAGRTLQPPVGRRVVRCGERRAGRAPAARRSRERRRAAGDVRPGRQQRAARRAGRGRRTARRRRAAATAPATAARTGAPAGRGARRPRSRRERSASVRPRSRARQPVMSQPLRHALACPQRLDALARRGSRPVARRRPSPRRPAAGRCRWSSSPHHTRPRPGSPRARPAQAAAAGGLARTCRRFRRPGRRCRPASPGATASTGGQRHDAVPGVVHRRAHQVVHRRVQHDEAACPVAA